MGRTKQTARKPSAAARSYSPPSPMYSVSEECEEDGSDAPEMFEDEHAYYRSKNKNPMEAKQSLIRLVSTEIIMNTRLHGELTCVRTIFDSWYSLLPHQTISTILEFLGVSEEWMTFFARYLEAPLKFMDDPSSEPRLRRRGMPGSHSLSDTLGENVLLCLDFAINQATAGAELYRSAMMFGFGTNIMRHARPLGVASSYLRRSWGSR